MLRNSYKYSLIIDIDEIIVNDTQSNTQSNTQSDIQDDDLKIKLNKINDYINKNNFVILNIPNENINNIYDLYFNNNIREIDNDIECLYYGIYYKINKNYELMKKYYLMAIENNATHSNSYAMNNLGSYYYDIEKDYDLMKKYYLMAIEKGNCNAMDNLGYYYENIEKDYNKAIKIYEKLVELNNSKGYNLIIRIYLEILKDKYKVIEYYERAKTNNIEINYEKELIENIRKEILEKKLNNEFLINDIYYIY
jgi:tetratricopeptide (TPR) repeat protein